MLDRLSLSLVHLPSSTYDIVLILLGADANTNNNARAEPAKLLTAPILAAIARSLKPGGKLEIQDDGAFATADTAERREAIFAGLVVEGDSMVKPMYSAAESVPLRLGGGGGKKQDGKDAVASTSAAGTGAVSLNLTGKRKNGPAEVPAGVGFVLPGDDLGDDDEDDDDELIDENDLLSDEDKKATLLQRKPPFTLHPFL